ncbi:uncharacterized protein At4g15970-like isoform X1 [Primulina tabacum]|uniref:uncharacterized protein At4g15970-like isoform X1 n=1 Tax=Primulina tabacum TaxID=48773 RepID=UPI003F5A283D
MRKMPINFEDGGTNRNHHESRPSRLGHHHHRHTTAGFSRLGVRILLLSMVVGLFYLVLSHSSFPIQLLRRSYSLNCLSPTCKPDRETASSSSNVKTHEFTSNNEDLPSYSRDEIKKLESALKKAAMENSKTVIITTLNAAWTEPNSIFDIFLESFSIGYQTQSLVNHVVVVALDQTAYSRCRTVHPHCFALTTSGVDFSGEATFMSQDYLKMMWRRIDFLRVVLELGYSFIFSDADVMWLRDPFPRFDPDADFQIACDVYKSNSTDPDNIPNGGFKYVKSNHRTIKFYRFWYRGRQYFPGKHDQDVLDMIKMHPYISEIELEMRYLDTASFSGFCEPSKDLDLVCTMHANCCVGLGKKIHDLRMVIEDWRRYMALSHTSVIGSWSAPWQCR